MLKPNSHRALAVAALVGACSLIAACGGDSEDTPAAGGSGNRAPTISGTPAPQVMQGQAYSFAPTATDPDGDALVFAIANKPSWATFSPSTGMLTGTPTPAQVGSYASIAISVSDGSITTNLAAFTIQVVGTATGSVTLSWMPPTLNTDNSPLTNLAGYKVYWGTTQGSYPNSVTLNNPGLSSYVVDQLTPATWYFAMTAVNAQGVESALSNAASKTLP